MLFNGSDGNKYSEEDFNINEYSTNCIHQAHIQGYGLRLTSQNMMIKNIMQESEKNYMMYIKIIQLASNIMPK